MKLHCARLAAFGSVVVRFLSAVADRLGWCGASGQPGVSWGDFAGFVAYTGKLNWFVPGSLIPPLAVFVRCLETVLGILLLAGWQTRVAPLAGGVLLRLFGLSMGMAAGFKAPLDCSVFSAAGGSLLLAACPEFPLSVDV